MLAQEYAGDDHVITRLDLCVTGPPLPLKLLTIDKLSRNYWWIREPKHRKPLTIDQIRLRKFY
jgi:hypothetical protein